MYTVTKRLLFKAIEGFLWFILLLTKYLQRTWYDLDRFWSPFKFPQNNMDSIAYYLSKRGNTEIICFIFLDPKNNMISDVSVLFK